MVKLNAKQLRSLQPSAVSHQTGKKNEIYIVLDNVLDTYNIGSIFRLADAVGAKKVYLCGGSATPPNHRIKKASINTTEVVEWEYCETAKEAIEKCKVDSAKCRVKKDLSLITQHSALQVVAIEQSKNSVPYDKFAYKLPIALVVGHETTGVSQEVLDVCDGVVELPMFGINISLNVMVSLGIVLYRIISDTVSS